jgi:hypothetical protein
MKESLKLLVLYFLQNLPESPYEQFNEAFELYKKTPTKSKMAEMNYNRRGYNEQNLKNLLYDLQKENGITDVEVANKIFTKAVNETSTTTSDLENFTDILTGRSINSLENKEGDFIEELSKNDKNPIQLEPLETDEESNKKIREDFPFLNEKDCPDVMYVIVGKRIVAYKNYQHLHAVLQKVNLGEVEMTEEEKLQLTIECDEAFTENRILWDELEHYAKNKAILGKHVIFREHNIQKEVEEMTQEKLVNFRTSSVKYFHDQKVALEKHKDNKEKLEEINQRISDRTYKL